MAAAMVIRGLQTKLVYCRGFSSLRGPVLSGIRRKEPRVFCNQTILRYVNRSAITRAKSRRGKSASKRQPVLGKDQDGWHIVYKGPVSAALVNQKNFTVLPLIALNFAPLMFLFTEHMTPSVKLVLGTTCVLVISCSTSMYYWLSKVYVLELFFKSDEQKFAILTPSYGLKPVRLEFHISELSLVEGRFWNVRTKDGNFFIDPRNQRAQKIMKLIQKWREKN